MAKIKDVSLVNVPEKIIVGDDQSDLTVLVDIEFHDIDLKLEMEYMLYILVYDVHGKIDIPILLTNWDESAIFPLAIEDRTDDFLGTYKTKLIAKEKSLIFKKDITLKLGVLGNRSSHYTKKLDTLAFLVPAISRASKWSDAYSTNIEF